MRFGPARRSSSPPGGGSGRRSAHFDVLLPCQIRRAGHVLRGRVPVAGKLGCRDVVSAVRPGRLFYITDSVSSRRYLLDTGSAFSIMPWESSDTPCGSNLTAADGRRIPCWGERPFTITIGGVPRQWSFLLAAVSFPIIGIDFLRCHGLLVDVANLCLLPGELPVAAVDLATEPGPSTAQPGSYAEVVKGSAYPSAGSVFLSGAVQPVPPASSLAAVSPFSASSAAATAGLGLGGLSVPSFPCGVQCLVGGVSPASPSRCPARHLYGGAAIDRQILPPRPCQVGGSKGGVPDYARRGHYSPLLQPMEQPLTHGPEERRFLAALRRLPPASPPDGGGQVPAAQHGRPGGPPRRLYGV